MRSTHEIELLRPFCLDHQHHILDAIAEHGSNNAAAKALGMNRRTIDRLVTRLKLKAAKHDASLHNGPERKAPPGYAIKGTSVLYNKDGELLQWVKTTTDWEQQQAAMQATLDALKEDLPRYPPVPAPPRDDYNDDLLNLLIVTDYHLGMLAWPEETGREEWNLKIAEELLYKWVASAVVRAPKAGTAMLALLGDFLHWDGFEAVTPTHHHVLDADTRFQKLVRSAIRIIRATINLLLEHYPKVHVKVCDGNHDPASGAWIREWLPELYLDDPRITIDNSADIYYAYEHGDCSLFFHHGHRRKATSAAKAENIASIFAAKFRETWGRTKHSFAHLGHIHTDIAIETSLMHVEHHRTLAAPDAHASRGGYISGRDAKVITYHKRHGRVGQTIISPDMVS